MCLRLVSDCYDDHPLYALGSRELKALFASAKKEGHSCCNYIVEAEREKRLAKMLGLTQTVDILHAHKREVKHLTYSKKKHIEAIWAAAVKQEIDQLTRIAKDPQE